MVSTCRAIGPEQHPVGLTVTRSAAVSSALRGSSVTPGRRLAMKVAGLHAFVAVSNHAWT